MRSIPRITSRDLSTKMRCFSAITIRARNKRAPDLRRSDASGRLQDIRLPGLSVTVRWMLSVRAPKVPQLPIPRPDLPGPMTPHPCVRVAVDEQQVIPDPRPPGHQIKTRARALWREASSRPAGLLVAVSSRPAKERSPAKTDPPAPPGFGSRPELSAAWCERRNPARTMTPSHASMMRCTDSLACQRVRR